MAFIVRTDSVAVLDLDWCKYAAASTAEVKTVTVLHKKEGWSREFSTVTEFYGSDKERTGGALRDINKQRIERGKEPYKVQDFEISREVFIPDPKVALEVAETKVKKALKDLNTRRYLAYLGKGVSFRDSLATLQKYKNRPAEKPQLLDEVSDFLEKRFNAEVVTGIEADDAIVMECYKSKNKIAVGEDKDFLSQPIRSFNPERPELGVVDGDCFGKIFFDTSLKSMPIRGFGRLFLYYQMVAGDSADTYKPHVFANKTWGEKSAYKALVGALNDKDAFERMVRVFKELYPEPKTVTNYRGEEIKIDWLYVMQEMMNMAKMLRFEGDYVKVEEILKNLKINY